MIYLSSYRWMLENAARLPARRVISLMDPGSAVPTPPGVPPEHHLRIDLHDVCAAAPGEPAWVLPCEDHIRQLLAFGSRWDGGEAVLVHCWAGVSRSSATALILACQRNPGREAEVARLLRQRGPWVMPNRLMVALADRLLRRRGRLTEALTAMGPPLAPLPQERDFPLELPVRFESAG